jgi:serine/threonine-protein kinase HipA
LRARVLQQFFRMIAVSCAVRNGDAHLKNFGILYAAPGSIVNLAPAYDIVCTSAYLPNDVMALTLDGRKSYPSEKILLRFAQQHCGIPPKEAKQVLSQIAEAITEVRQLMRIYAADHPSFQMISARIDNAWKQGTRRSLMA